MRVPKTILSLALVACSPATSTPPDATPNEPSTAPAPVPVANQASTDEAPIDPRFTATVLAAARDYSGWSRVDELPNLAPVLCRAPMGLDYGFPSHARLSHADDAGHGKKLYFLFAGQGKRDARHDYLALGTRGDAAIPIGFTIVKQSWTAVPGPVPTSNAAANAPPGPPLELAVTTDAPPPITWVDHEGERLHTGEQAELFVMAKVGAVDMPGTDAGWIYGTLTSDGLTVTSAGRVERCMDCHDAATHERLFGLQKTKAFAEVKSSPWGGGHRSPPPELGLE